MEECKEHTGWEMPCAVCEVRAVSEGNNEVIVPTAYDVLKGIYERCTGPFDDPVIERSEWESMERIYGKK